MTRSAERLPTVDSPLAKLVIELTDHTLSHTERLIILQRVIGVANDDIATTIAQMLAEEARQREPEVVLPDLSFEALLKAIDADPDIPIKSRTRVISCLSTNRTAISIGSTKENRVLDARFVKQCLEVYNYDQFRNSRYGRELKLRNMGAITFGYLLKHLRLLITANVAQSLPTEQ